MFSRSKEGNYQELKQRMLLRTEATEGHEVQGASIPEIFIRLTGISSLRLVGKLHVLTVFFSIASVLLGH